MKTLLPTPQFMRGMRAEVSRGSFSDHIDEQFLKHRARYIRWAQFIDRQYTGQNSEAFLWDAWDMMVEKRIAFIAAERITREVVDTETME